MSLLKVPNPNGRSNAEVVRPWVNGMDLVRRPSETWIIDFASLGEQEASEYVAPFDYIEEKVKPSRMVNRDKRSRDYWWQHQRSRPDMRQAISGLKRYIVTPRVSKHRIWTLVDATTIPDSRVVVVAREALDFLGVLMSSIHELWSLKMGGWHGVGNDPQYNVTTCFETFPMPNHDYDADQLIEKWAGHLIGVRDSLFQDDDKLTLTNLYNQVDQLRRMPDAEHPVWPLVKAHDKLNKAVAAAYSWEWPLDDDEVLARLLALNLERSAAKS